MFQFSTAHWCERRIGAASGQAGPEVWPSRTHVQNGKRLAAYGDCASTEKGTCNAAYIRVVLLAIGEGATISQFGGLQAATAMVGFKDITAYTASKHAVISLTKAAIL